MLSKVIFNMAKRTVSFKFKDRLLANSIPVQALTTAEAKSKLKSTARDPRTKKLGIGLNGTEGQINFLENLLKRLK